MTAMYPPGTRGRAGLWISSWYLHVFWASWIVAPWLVDAPGIIPGRASGLLKQIYLTFALRFHFLSFYFARALRVVQITWLPFAYMLENLFFRMRTLGWNYVKRNFLARKFPSETISGTIFCCNNRIAFLQGRALGHPETRSITTKSWEYRIDQGSLKESVARLGGGGRFDNVTAGCCAGWHWVPWTTPCTNRAKHTMRSC